MYLACGASLCAYGLVFCSCHEPTQYSVTALLSTLDVAVAELFGHGENTAPEIQHYLCLPTAPASDTMATTFAPAALSISQRQGKLPNKDSKTTQQQHKKNQIEITYISTSVEKLYGQRQNKRSDTMGNGIEQVQGNVSNAVAARASDERQSNKLCHELEIEKPIVYCTMPQKADPSDHLQTEGTLKSNKWLKEDIFNELSQALEKCTDGDLALPSKFDSTNEEDLVLSHLVIELLNDELHYERTHRFKQIKIFSNGLLPFKHNSRTLLSPLLLALRCNNYVSLSNILKARVNEMVSFPLIYKRDSSRVQDSTNALAGTSAISDIDFQSKSLIISERSMTINNAALAIISSKKLKIQPPPLMMPAPVIFTNTKICVPQGKVHCNLSTDKRVGMNQRRMYFPVDGILSIISDSFQDTLNFVAEFGDSVLESLCTEMIEECIEPSSLSHLSPASAEVLSREISSILKEIANENSPSPALDLILSSSILDIDVDDAAFDYEFLSDESNDLRRSRSSGRCE